MINDDDIWNSIESMARAQNISCSRMACRSGLDATIFNKSKRTDQYGKSRCVSMRSVLKVLNALNLKMAYFGAIVDAHSEQRNQIK